MNYPYKTRGMEGNQHRGENVPHVVVLNKPEQIERLHLLTLKQAIKTHLQFNGRMRLTRTATPANLRALAGRITGKTYPRSRQALEQALKDLEQLA